MWRGDYLYLVENLVLKDFRIRYRNMSLGVLWSLLNPLVMMGVLTFVFTKVFANPNIKHYAAFVLCGIVPFNFFTVAWITGTTSIVDNAGLIKRVPVPREVVPITSVLSNCVHLLVQIGLLITVLLVSGIAVSRQWLWLPLVWGMQIVFVCGLALFFSAVNVFVRDTRYLVESATTVLFWLVPVIYPQEMIKKEYIPLYELNPVAAQVISLRRILLSGQSPIGSTMAKLAGVSLGVFLLGLLVFRRLKPMFYEHI
jgi:ABC-type polysaccharide/polyol phosphate export permease